MNIFSSRFATACLVGLMALAAPAHALRLETTLASAPVAVSAEAAPVAAHAEPVVAYLRSALGKRYRRGATGEGQAYDCSGLVQQAYAAAGRELPRVTSQQIQTGSVIPATAAKAGDLLFYRFGRGASAPLHVAIYVGNGRAIHASVSHRIVREVNITTAVWAQHFVKAIRPA
ncbi:MAG: C40 family peptidase [Pseudomonadota bacterium]